MRFYFVDRIEEIEPGKYATGIKNITYNEDFLEDHFPDHPIYPGTLAIEALAQIGGFLVECTFNAAPQQTIPRRAVLAQVEKAKFYDPITPGDQLLLRCEMLSSLEGAAQVKAEARIGQTIAATATLTFVLWSIKSDRVHEQRQKLYRQWTSHLKLNFPIR
jgi:3-hydroxyacyl-[acyl-carrier-protein] dehydratase